MYKEYRDTTLTGAVAQMCKSFRAALLLLFVLLSHSILDSELSGRHRARKSCIQIVRTATLKASECKRPSTLQFHVSVVFLIFGSFPLFLALAGF